MDEKLYKTLGNTKSEELIMKTECLWQLLDVGTTRKSGVVYGRVIEDIAKEFIREYLPPENIIKSGLIFNSQSQRMSPQIDGIIYSGAPLLDFTDVAVVETKQVKAIIEVKSYVNITSLFGEIDKDSRDPNTGLAYGFHKRKDFLSPEAKYVLFAFELGMDKSKEGIIQRLNDVCDSYAIALRYNTKAERANGKERYSYNFNNSLSSFIEWLRSLSSP